MIIKDVKIDTSGSMAILSAKCKIRKIGWDTIYFGVSRENQAYIYDDASPFAAALLIPSMMQGEDLIIKGSISKKLFEGMHQVMHEVNTTWDKKLKLIKIIPDEITEDESQSKNVASFFTGGVDSFYTYLHHKTDKNKVDRVDSFVLVNGFDIHPKDTKVWELALKNIKTIAAKENIELVEVITNLHQLLEPICSWGEYNNGSCLAAVGLFLRNRFAKIYIPSSYTIEQQKQYEAMREAIGTTVTVDELWSSESIQFIHDGADVTRLDKVKLQIAKSDVALQYLRVCYVNKNQSYNCGNCDKCNRTMVNLYLAGALDKAKTFPNKLNIENISKIYTSPLYCECFYKENLTDLEKRNLNPELQIAIKESFNRSVKRHKGIKNSLNQKIIHKTIRKLVYIDHVYFGGYTYSNISKLLNHKQLNYIYSVTDCRPLTIATTSTTLNGLLAR